jgi:CheY-like chemotaxis protein
MIMGNANTVLLVVDDAAERLRLEQALAGAGYLVAAAASGEEALWILDNEHCDALFAAVSLRGMSGLELTQEVRARGNRLPIVMLAGDRSRPVDAPARAAGANEVMAQPWTAEAVVAAALRVSPRVDAAQVATGAPSAETLPAQTVSEPIRRLKNIILFLLAPFVGLVYLLSFPIVGMGMLIWTSLAWKKRRAEESGATPAPALQTRGVLASLALIPGALLLGVAFAVIGPLLGIGVLLWFGFQVWGRIGAKALAT